MAKYRVRVDVEFLVEIDENNLEVDGPPALQGDSHKVAENRAMWVLFRSDIARHDAALAKELHAVRRQFGVRILVHAHDGRLSREDGQRPGIPAQDPDA